MMSGMISSECACDVLTYVHVRDVHVIRFLNPFASHKRSYCALYQCLDIISL